MGIALETPFFYILWPAQCIAMQCILERFWKKITCSFDCFAWKSWVHKSVLRDPVISKVLVVSKTWRGTTLYYDSIYEYIHIAWCGKQNLRGFNFFPEKNPWWLNCNVSAQWALAKEGFVAGTGAEQPKIGDPPSPSPSPSLCPLLTTCLLFCQSAKSPPYNLLS